MIHPWRWMRLMYGTLFTQRYYSKFLSSIIYTQFNSKQAILIQ